jgi:hypothetical protein
MKSWFPTEAAGPEASVIFFLLRQLTLQAASMHQDTKLSMHSVY